MVTRIEFRRIKTSALLYDNETDLLEIPIYRTNQDKLPTLIGDKRRLLQVLINLVKNALKFTSSGHITIKTLFCEADQRLVVEVEDSGSGISEEELPLLFNKFGKM